MNFYQTLIITLITILLTTLVNISLFLFKEYYTNNIKEFVNLRRKTIEIFMKYEYLIVNPINLDKLDRDSNLKDFVYKAKSEVGELAGKWHSYSLRKHNLLCKRKILGAKVSKDLKSLALGLTYYSFNEDDSRTFKHEVQKIKNTKKI